MHAFDSAVAAVLGPSQSALPENLVLDLLGSLEYYQVPLAIQNGSFVCARGYNSQNACSQFLVWAMATSRCAIRPFTQAEVLKHISQQGSKSRKMWEGWGVDHTTLEEERQTLNRVATPWFERSDFWGRPQPSEILPPLLFVHMCEYRQVLDDDGLGLVGVERALANLRRPGVRSQFTARLATELGNKVQMGPNPRRNCILQRALTTIISLKPAPDPLRRTRASQSPALFTSVNPRERKPTPAADPLRRTRASQSATQAIAQVQEQLGKRNGLIPMCSREG